MYGLKNTQNQLTSLFIIRWYSNDISGKKKKRMMIYCA